MLEYLEREFKRAIGHREFWRADKLFRAYQYQRQIDIIREGRRLKNESESV